MMLSDPGGLRWCSQEFIALSCVPVPRAHGERCGPVQQPPRSEHAWWQSRARIHHVPRARGSACGRPVSATCSGADALSGARREEGSAISASKILRRKSEEKERERQRIREADAQRARLEIRQVGLFFMCPRNALRLQC